MKKTVIALMLVSLFAPGALGQDPPSSYPNDNDMTLGVQKDHSHSKLSAGTSAGATSLPVLDSSQFAIGEWVTIKDTDLRQISNIAGNTLTITSGTSIPFTSNDPVDGYQSAIYHNALRVAIKSIEAGGAGVASGATLPSTCSPGAAGLFFQTTTDIGLFLCVSTNAWRNLIASGDPAVASYVDLYPPSDNNSFGFVSPLTRSTRLRLRMPGADPTAGQILACGAPDGSTPPVSTCAWTSAGGTNITALTGDVSASGSGSVATTLATVNSSPGSCGDTSHTCSLSIDLKGRVLSQSNTAISGVGGGGSGPSVTITTSSQPDPGGVWAVIINNASGAATYTLPDGASGYQRTYRNATSRTGVITIQVPASNSIDLNGTNGSSSTGTIYSTGALADQVTLLADAAHHWYATPLKGTWAAGTYSPTGWGWTTMSNSNWTGLTNIQWTGLVN